MLSLLLKTAIIQNANKLVMPHFSAVVHSETAASKAMAFGITQLTV